MLDKLDQSEEPLAEGCHIEETVFVYDHLLPGFYRIRKCKFLSFHFYLDYYDHPFFREDVMLTNKFKLLGKLRALIIETITIISNLNLFKLCIVIMSVNPAILPFF